MQTRACGISPISVSPASNVLTQALICNSLSDDLTLAMERSALGFIMRRGVLPMRREDSPLSDVNVQSG
jgi:hypothetical protein